MDGVVVRKPRRDVRWFFEESTPFALTVAAVGTAAVAVGIVGPAVILIANGVTPVDSLIEGFRSTAFRVACFGAIALGAFAVLAGGVTYRLMPTKLAREEAAGGAIAGAQGIAIGLALLLFIGGAVDKFARNFLDFEILDGSSGAFVRAAKNTLQLAITSELLGIAGGLVLAIFVVSRRPVMRAPVRAYINFFRGTPLLWQLSFFGIGFLFAFPYDISTYTIAIAVFSLNAAAYSAEVFRAGIQSVDRGQLEAARSLGMSYAQALRYSVIPQAVRRVIPPLLNEFVILVKDTSLVLVLGLAGAERELMSVGQQGYYDTFNSTYLAATALGYLAVCLPMIRLVNIVERRLRSGLVGVTGG